MKIETAIFNLGLNFTRIRLLAVQQSSSFNGGQEMESLSAHIYHYLALVAERGLWCIVG